MEVELIGKITGLNVKKVEEIIETMIQKHGVE